MSGEISQNDRVLRALRAFGRGGVSTVDFLAPGVIDDDEPITRLAARINNLRARGHKITTEMYTTPGGARLARYVLERDAEAPAPAPQEPTPPADNTAAGGALPLFDLGTAVPPATPVRANHYSLEEAL